MLEDVADHDVVGLLIRELGKGSDPELYGTFAPRVVGAWSPTKDKTTQQGQDDAAISDAGGWRDSFLVHREGTWLLTEGPLPGEGCVELWARGERAGDGTPRLALPKSNAQACHGHSVPTPD